MEIIAVDFDGCLCEAKWPEIGPPRMPVIGELIRRQAEGAKVVLWTCRVGEQLTDAILWCLNYGLKFDAVNDNLQENKERYGNNSRKVWATEYWDDKNVLIVGEGAVTSMVYPKSDGGMIVREWMTEGPTFVRPPEWRPKTSSGMGIWERVKRAMGRGRS